MMTTIIEFPKITDYFEVSEENDFEAAFKEDYLLNLFK